MSRTNKGGARLRAITLFAGAAAIAAGVFAATHHQPPTESCDIVPTAIFGSKTFKVECHDLNELASYRIVTNGDAVQSAPDLGLGDGTSAADARGLAGTGSGPLVLTLDGEGNASAYFSTASSSTTDASTNVKLQRDDSGWADVANSDSVPAYYLSFTMSPTSINQTESFNFGSVSGLLDDNYRVSVVNSSSLSPVNTGMSNSTGSGTSGSPDGLDTANSPYLNKSGAITDNTLSASAPTYYLATVNFMGSVTIKGAIYDASGTLIGVSSNSVAITGS